MAGVTGCYDPGSLDASFLHKQDNLMLVWIKGQQDNDSNKSKTIVLLTSLYSAFAATYQSDHSGVKLFYL